MWRCVVRLMQVTNATPPYSTVEMLTTLDGPAVIDAKARCWSKIPSRNIAMTYCMERCGYPTVKKCEDLFIRFDRIQERDRQTDRHRTTTYAALMQSIARQKLIAMGPHGFHFRVGRNIAKIFATVLFLRGELSCRRRYEKISILDQHLAVYPKRYKMWLVTIEDE